MSWEENENSTTYNVVINHEEQYSIWPIEREIPLGWKAVGKSGPKVECLAYIKEVWTDMRPLSLRKKMEEMAKQATEQSPQPPPKTDDTPPKKSLVERLTEGEHAVEASLRPEKTVKALQECIDRSYVHIKFTETRGGTELGIKLDHEASDFSIADFDNQTGSVHLAGDLTLDYVKVRCIADIDLKTLAGKGRLELIGA